jgi:hypothetical protein
VDSRDIGRRSHIEQPALVRVGPPACGSTSSDGRRRLQAPDVALQLGSRQATVAADVDGSEFAGLHECVDRRPTDAKHLRGLLRGQQKGVGGQYLAKPVRIAHVVTPRHGSVMATLSGEAE